MKTLSIEIFNKMWYLRFVEQNGSELCEINGDTYFGKCNYPTNEIIIAYGMSVPRTYETITHEITHAVIYQMVMNKQEFTNEELCQFMERYCSYIYNKVDEIMTKLELL